VTIDAVILGGIFLVVAMIVSLRILLRAPGEKESEVWVVQCPVGRELAIVEACAEGLGACVRDCSRWPRHLDCPQTCLEKVHSPNKVHSETAR
jgi:hypothetical protein